jgi:hypothetical protein
VLQAIQLGTADNSIRFRAKAAGVVEKVSGVDDKPCVPISCRSEAGKSRGQTFAAAAATVAA